MSETKKEPGMAQLAAVLLIITVIVAALLGIINQVTAPLIAANNEASLNQALVALIPDAEFETIEANDPNGVVLNVYKASDDKGYCVEAAPTGFGGAIDMIVGINGDGTLAGIQILSMSETPGLGARASEDKGDDDFADQFVGAAADGSLAVTKDGGTIEAITGATITSRAVTSGINAACEYVASLS